MQRFWIVLVVTIVLLGFALGTGLPMFHRAFYVLGLLLVLSAVWGRLLIAGLDLELRRPVLRSRVGHHIEESVVVRRRNRFLRGVVEIQEITDMPVSAPGAAVALGSGESTTIDLNIVCPKRGLFSLGPLIVSGSDPFGLFRLGRAVGETCQIIVHPDARDLHGFEALPADLPGEGARHLRSPNVTTSAYGIRDYVVGDSLNRLSWRSTAHHNRLMVKEFEVEPANSTWLLLDMDRRSHKGSGDDGTEETAIAIAASICKYYADLNFPVGFMAHGNERIVIPAQRGSGQLLMIMDALATLRAYGDQPLLDLIADFRTRAGRYTSVAIVTSNTGSDWVEGIRHLLEGKVRVTAVIVDDDLNSKDHPDSAYQSAGLGITTYTVKSGAFADSGLTALGGPQVASTPPMKHP